MAGAMRKMAVYLGLVEDDRYDEYEYEDERRSGRGPERVGGPDRVDARGDQRARPGAAREEQLREHQRAGATVATMTDRRAPVVALPGASAPSPADLTRITTIHPRTYNEAKTIGECFRGGTPVIMNLTEMEDADAKRLVDFAAGLVFGCHGTIERVTNKVFLLSPANVTVTAEDKARMAESGFFNQS
ncbi:MAG: cell division protein SepF [Actinomycetota bacterium]|nr:cell division protein SepF [Actinomycetota bacterium]